MKRRRIARGAVKESTYSHTTHVDESAGVYDVDCSGLLDLILERVAPRQLEHVCTPTEEGAPRLRCNFMKNSPNRRRTRLAAEVGRGWIGSLMRRPGDVDRLAARGAEGRARTRGT